MNLTSCPPGSSTPVHWPNLPDSLTHLQGTVFQAASFPLPVCVHCFDPELTTQHSHVHCSSINKTVSFSLRHSSRQPEAREPKADKEGWALTDKCYGNDGRSALNISSANGDSPMIGDAVFGLECCLVTEVALNTSQNEQSDKWRDKDEKSSSCIERRELCECFSLLFLLWSII